MIEQFLQKKIADLLIEFVEFEKNTLLSMQGLKLTNSKIKPKLVDIMSQILGMPLELSEGMVDEIKLNMPWQKLFLVTNSSIKLQISGFKLKTKLKNEFNLNYNIKSRQNLIKHLTSKLISSQQSTSPLVKKLKQYFMDTLQLGIKDIHLEIEVDLEQKIDLIIKFQSIIGRQEHKVNTLKVNVQNFSVSYRVKNSKPEPLLYPTNMILTRQKHHQKTEIVSQKSAKIQKIHLNINNHNFNDIRRLLCLVSWHNSFMHLPLHLWKEKPLPLIKTKPIRKFQYYVTLMRQKFKVQNFRKTIEERKIYNSLYTQILKGSKDIAKRKNLDEMEEKMYVWRIIAYRNFCIQRLKDQSKKKNEQIEKKIKIQEISEKDNKSFEEKTQIVKAESKLNGFSWMKSWLRTESNEKQLIDELEQKMNKIETIPSVSILNVTVRQILVSVDIITYSAKQSFLLAKALDITYSYQRDDKFESQKHEAIFGKFRIEYNQYLGHDKKYLCLLETIRQGEIRMNLQVQESQEEFQEIQNFMQFRSYPNFHVKIQPMKVCINRQVMERLSVFDFQRVESLSQASQMNIVKHIDPYNILKEMNKSFSPRMHPKEVVRKLKQISKGQDTINTGDHQNIKYFQTGLEILIPQQMAKQLFPCNEIVCQIQRVECQLHGSVRKEINLKQISLKCKFPDEEGHNYEAMLVLGQKRVENFTFLNPFSMKIEERQGQNQHTKFYDIFVTKSLVFDFQCDQKVSKLIKILTALKPSSKQTRNLYRMKMRRKQSIGQEFIDACENLNEHIFKSALSASDIKPKKYSPILQKVRDIFIKTENIKIQFKEATLEVSPIIIQVHDESIDAMYVSSDEKKRVIFEIHDIKKFKSYLENISKGVKKILPQTQKSIPKLSNQDQQIQSQKKTQINVSKINFQLTVYYEKISFLKVKLFEIQLTSQENKKLVDLTFMTEFRNGAAKESPFLPLIQKTKVFYLQKKSYNCFLRQFTISSLSVDLTPQIFKFLTKIYRIYLESLQSAVKIQNETLNYIKLNSMVNRYVDVKPFQTQCLQAEKDCNMILFGNKIELNLKNHCQTHQLTENCYLIKLEKTLRVHTLSSNIKIVNLQDRTIWISIKDQIQEDIIFAPKTDEIIDIKYLSAAKSFDFNENELNSRSRGASIHRKQQKGNENINMPLKPKEEYNILVKSEDEYLQIIDQGVSFKQVKISQILAKREIIVVDEEKDDYLILRCSQNTIDKIVYFKIEILSPIYIVNKLPWKISYRIGKEGLDVESIVNTKGRIIKKKSFQAIPMQKILPLQHNKIRSILYQEIIDIEIVMKEFSGFFKVGSIIEEMKKMKGKAQKWQESTLVCLSNGKKNIQIILKLQISDQALKIKVYPEYVFVNLCEMDIFFKIKQSEYTYPEIKLKTIKDSRKEHNLTDQQMEIQSFVKTYISLGNDKYDEKGILQQLFMDFEDRIEIFAGTIDKNLKRFIVYESGTRLSSSSSNGYNSTGGGYASGYGSGSDSKEHMAHYCTQELWSDSTIQYGASKAQVHYRNIRIEEYFNLVIFVPTIKIINKSNSTFLVKSRANKRLIKIQGQEMNYLSINSEGFSVQALDENEEVNLNEWFNINVYILGTVYYAKQLSSNGYESKEYTLRKKRLRKRPKLFYRIVLSQHERGIQVLIEQSQYPPLSFINKTNLKLKVEEENEGYEEELGPNEMAEFAPTKNPYSQPVFKLFYAQHYEYLFVETFQVDEFKAIPCSKSSKFVISIEEFKEKKIVVFGDQKLLQMSQIKNQFQIEKVQKLIININTIVLSFMTQFYKEFSALKISGVEFQKEDKNSKQQFKFKVSDIEGYDYSGIHPKIGFQKLHQQKIDIFSTLTKPISNHLDKSIFNSKIVISYHKNAVIVQKCHLKLAPLKIIFNSYLILESIKIYETEVLSFLKLLKTYNGNLQKKISKPGITKKQFIFESFIWQGTSVTLKCLNLNIFCAFFDKRHYKWIIKFLEWVGDLKPIKFSKHTIQYENYTIEKLIRRIDIKKKMGEFANVLFEYPARQFLDMVGILLGENEINYKLKAKMLLKIAKGFGKLVYNSGLVPGISKSQKINESEQGHMSYRQQFQQTHSIKTTQTVLDKIKIFEFAEWKYQEKFSPNKLTLSPINRLERYNLRNMILQYDIKFSRVKIALDSFYGNKIHRKIQFVECINPTVVLGLTEESIVLYFEDKQQWVVKKHQQVVDLYFIVPKKVSKFSLEARKILKIVTTLSSSQSPNDKNSVLNKGQQQITNYDKSKLNTYEINDPWLSSEKLQEFKAFIKSNKLVTEF